MVDQSESKSFIVITTEVIAAHTGLSQRFLEADQIQDAFSQTLAMNVYEMDEDESEEHVFQPPVWNMPSTFTGVGTWQRFCSCGKTKVGWNSKQEAEEGSPLCVFASPVAQDLQCKLLMIDGLVIMHDTES